MANDRLVLGREPALYAGMISAALQVAIAVGAPLSDVQTGAINAAVGAILAAVVAFGTRPVAPNIATGAFVAIANLAMAFGAPIPDELLATGSALIVAVLAFLQRTSVTPVAARTTG